MRHGGEWGGVFSLSDDAFWLLLLSGMLSLFAGEWIEIVEWYNIEVCAWRKPQGGIHWRWWAGC